MKAEKLQMRVRRMLRFFILHPSSFILIFFLPGCVQPHPSAHRATDINPKQATAAFWFAKPAVASVDSPNFYRLWDAAARVARARGFEIDQSDPRLGLMTTLPLSTQQIWELWRDDTPHLKDQLRSTLAEYRQIIRFEFQHLSDGSYRLTPKVVLERHAERENRVTAVVNYRTVFTRTPAQSQDYSIDEPVTPPDYWYATGRDYGLERDLAREIDHRAAR
jgi:hypothetical protein